MKFDPLFHKYSSKRNVVYGKKGMVAASHPLAAEAGIEVMKKGGNAIDAAIATAASLTVLEPTANGIGGDAFALVWSKGKLYGLNSSGPSPKALTYEKMKEKGFDEVPVYGFDPVTVPGAPAAWAELTKKFGNLSLKENLAPAINYAREGHPVAPGVAYNWNRAFKNYTEKLKGEEFKYWFETFATNNRAPLPGEIWASPNHASTLEEIANSDAESFYRGELADKIHEFSKQYGGFITKEDLANFYPEWVEPISVNYRGYDVWEIPPNGHGIIALMALNILNNFEFKEKDSVETYHIMMEAMKLAFIDGQEYIADARSMEYTCEELLSKEYGKNRAKLINETALSPEPGTPIKGGTVYFAAADGEGNMISYIQSNYMGFGSGLVVPGTGIGLHNRGNNFNMREGHPNCVGPEKKPYHTIIPGFLTKDNKPIGPFGVMGGFMQPQGHVQVITNTIDFNLNPQDTLDAPRWQWTKEKTVLVEDTLPNSIANSLLRKGHDLVPQINSGTFGRGQIIWIDENGVLCGGTESRTDGHIAVW